MDFLNNRLLPLPINWFLRLIQTHEIRGKHYLYKKLSKFYGQKIISYWINGRPFYIPLDEWCFWLEFGPENYYLEEMIPFCSVINRFEQEFTFIDLGADIGVVSPLIEAHCHFLRNIIAVEPNPGSYALLEQNFFEISSRFKGFNCAVSDFNGNAKFIASQNSTIDHEGHLDTSSSGEMPVYTLDILLDGIDFQLAEFVVIKIDVEGQEIQAIEGGREVISKAKKLVVLLEIHPNVLADTETTPELLFESIERIRPIYWKIPKFANRQVDRRTLLFDQLPIQQYDIIGISE